MRKIISYILRVFKFFFSYGIFNFYGIVCSQKLQVQPRVPLKIRQGVREDILSVNEMYFMGKSSVIRGQNQLFDKGCQMYVGFVDNRPVSVGWLFCGSEFFGVGLRVKIKPDEAFILGCYTHPDFRGKNIYPSMLYYLLEDAEKKGKKKCFLHTDLCNKASNAGVKKVGFSFIERRHIFRSFGQVFNGNWNSPAKDFN